MTFLTFYQKSTSAKRGLTRFPNPGHIVVQSTGKCVTLKPGSTEPPFLFTVADCYGNDDSGQEASNFVQEQDGPIYFVGTWVLDQHTFLFHGCSWSILRLCSTQADGSQNWHSDICHSGYFGAFDAKTSGPVGFGCYDNESAETAGLLLAKWTFVSPPPPRRMIG